MPTKFKPVVKSKIKIKRNDEVIVIAGKDKGKKGRVLRVLADKNRVLVQGVMMMKKHVKPNPQKNIQGGIAEQEATIHISNVQLVDGEGKATKVGTRVEGDKNVRYAKTTGAALPVKK
ncbi:LSU ribosomal protein L24P [Granulicella rosea]|uniref:Large ribosomal subunit protein uL24 n=1 Tax=Granulicella rosea TaxID=474952 RepID=A0A239KCA5_9BACT|nr:50S ribosomal protein L24 [Granulicella rosea]SNT15715.1 LSU ribosomal protein L24P [Granulicella rosea]